MPAVASRIRIPRTARLTTPFNPKTLVAIDTETTGVHHWLGDQPFAVSMADQDRNVWYCEWRVDPWTREVKPNRRDLDFIRDILRNPRLPKVFHNSKFDLRQLARVGCDQFAGTIHDVLYASRVANTLEWEYGLKFLGLRHAGIPIDDEKELGDVVKKVRAIAAKLGWKVAKNLPGQDRYGDQPYKADYWMPRELAIRHPELALGGWEGACERYAVMDALRTIILGEMYLELFKEDEVLDRTYRMEQELAKEVWRMESRGVSYSPERGTKEGQFYREKKERLLKELRADIKKPDFNPGSTPQLQKVIFGGEPYKLKVYDRTKTGQPSTDADALRLHGTHPFVGKLISWRAAKKGVEFYDKYAMMAVLDLLDETTGGWCIHCSFNQAGARTGRFSCQDPNFQQAADTSKSARGQEWINSRVPFGPRPGYYWWACDFAQQEVRIFAEISQEPRLLEALHAGRDINTEIANRAWGGKGNHAALEAASYTLELGNTSLNRKTASNVDQQAILDLWDEFEWNTELARLGALNDRALDVANRWLARFDYDIVKAEKSIGTGLKRTRNKGKITMFNVIYGGGWKAVKAMLYCDDDTAKRTLDAIHRGFPGVKPFMRALSSRAGRDRCVYDLYDRRLNVDPKYSYRAVNYSVQGTAASMMKDAIIRTARYLRECGVDCHVLMTIHDELIFEVAKKHAYPHLLRGIVRIMEDNEGRMGVPMIVEPNLHVRRWDEKIELDPKTMKRKVKG